MRDTQDNRRWIAALRGQASDGSPLPQPYIQGRSQLGAPFGDAVPNTLADGSINAAAFVWCCLGVRADITGDTVLRNSNTYPSGPRQRVEVRPELDPDGEGFFAALSDAALAAYEMADEDQSACIRMNDGDNWDFPTIADVLERALEHFDGNVEAAAHERRSAELTATAGDDAPGGAHEEETSS